MNLFKMIFGSLLAICVSSFSPLSAAEPIKLEIRNQLITVSNPTVTIGDLCKITGGNSKLRSRVAGLDVEELGDTKSTRVSKRQVSLRLTFAGIDRSTFEIEGPEAVNVSLVNTKEIRALVETHLCQELSAQFGIAKEDVQVLLLEFDPEAINQTIDTTDFTTMAMFPTQLPLGEKQIQIDLKDHRGKRISLKPRVRIVVQTNVYVTTAYIPRGATLSPSNVKQVKRPLVGNDAGPLDDRCIGCVASRDIPAHQVVTSRLVTAPKKVKAIGVKRNDIVDVILNRGPLSLRMKNAKVMTDGSIGETVRVLNTSSNRQLNAIVLDRATVQIKNSP